MSSLSEPADGVRIRPAELADAEGIALVNICGWQTAFVPFFSEDYLNGLSVDDRTGRWRRSFAMANFQTLVADEDSKIVGFASLGPTEDVEKDVGEVHALYVDPDCWGRGIGSSLLNAAEEGLRHGGFSRAILWTISAYERTRSFYERRGWRPDGATKQHPAGPELVRLARELAAGRAA